jgi:hypothetical protein
LDNGGFVELLGILPSTGKSVVSTMDLYIPIDKINDAPLVSIFVITNIVYCHDLDFPA